MNRQLALVVTAGSVVGYLMAVQFHVLYLPIGFAAGVASVSFALETIEET